MDARTAGQLPPPPPPPTTAQLTTPRTGRTPWQRPGQGSKRGLPAPARQQPARDKDADVGGERPGRRPRVGGGERRVGAGLSRAMDPRFPRTLVPRCGQISSLWRKVGWGGAKVQARRRSTRHAWGETARGACQAVALSTALHASPAHPPSPAGAAPSLRKVCAAANDVCAAANDDVTGSAQETNILRNPGPVSTDLRVPAVTAADRRFSHSPPPRSEPRAGRGGPQQSPSATRAPAEERNGADGAPVEGESGDAQGRRGHKPPPRRAPATAQQEWRGPARVAACPQVAGRRARRQASKRTG